MEPAGIDTEESISPAFVAWRAGTTNVVPIRQAGNLFQGSLKGQQIRAQNLIKIVPSVLY